MRPWLIVVENTKVFKLKNKKMICSLYLRCDWCSHVVRIEGSVKREDHSKYFSKQAQVKLIRQSYLWFVECCTCASDREQFG